MKMYIAGKITGDPNYRQKFKEAENHLEKLWHTVMNPASMPCGFEWDEYMMICKMMLTVCEGVYFLSDWKESQGAMQEHQWAVEMGKHIIYEGECQ